MSNQDRLPQLCEAINGMIKSVGGETIVFFSEACRPSFDGGDIKNKLNEMSWFQMRNYICEKCNLVFLGECSNNEDVNCMSFGIASFCTTKIVCDIHSVLPRRILTEGIGSGTVGIKFISGEIVWAIHMPLDFKTEIIENNMAHKAMKGLCSLMKSYPNSICAFGDFNIIPGKISDCIMAGCDSDFKFCCENKLTFFGAYYDTFIPRNEDNEKWELI